MPLYTTSRCCWNSLQPASKTWDTTQQHTYPPCTTCIRPLPCTRCARKITNPPRTRTPWAACTQAFAQHRTVCSRSRRRLGVKARTHARPTAVATTQKTTPPSGPCITAAPQGRTTHQQGATAPPASQAGGPSCSCFHVSGVTVLLTVLLCRRLFCDSLGRDTHTHYTHTTQTACRKTGLSCALSQATGLVHGNMTSLMHG